MLLLAGAAVLTAGLIVATPEWWGRQVRVVMTGAGRNWLPLLLIGAGAAMMLAWTVRTLHRSRWPGRVRRGRREPIAVWLPQSVHIGGLLLLSITVAVGMGALLWWALGKPAVDALPPTVSGGQTGPAWTVSNTFDALKIVLSVVAGIGAVVALTVAYRKQDQGESAEHREETKLFNDRFGKAADQLGSDKAAVRLAGVYAMTGLADDWREGRQTCIDVLCAYVRMPWPEPPPPSEAGSEAGAASAETESTSETPAVTAREIAEEGQVRHTIIRVIREHIRPGKLGDVDRWHRHHFDFAGAVFHGADLSEIAVNDETIVDFGGAMFSGGTVGFGGAMFLGRHCGLRRRDVLGRHRRLRRRDVLGRHRGPQQRDVCRPRVCRLRWRDVLGRHGRRPHRGPLRRHDQFCRRHVPWRYGHVRSYKFLRYQP
jgi:hypothetical protein